MTSLKNIIWAEISLSVYTCAASTCTARVLYKQYNVGTAFTWLVILFLFPVFGTINYLLVGEPWLGSARTKRTGEMSRFYSGLVERYLKEMYFDVSDKIKPCCHGISRVATRSTGSDVTQGNGTTLLATIDDIIDTMLTDIEAAEHSYLLTFYIIKPQGRIEELLGAVLRVAEHGADYTILTDAVGSSGFLGNAWVGELRSAGVEMHSALSVGPLRTLFTCSDLRNHRKIIVIDGEIDYTGSYNLADPCFFKKGSGVGEWVDVMVRCTRPLVLEMSAVFFAGLAVETNGDLQDIQQYLTEYEDHIPELLPENINRGSVVAQVIPSMSEQGDQVIYKTIISATHSITERITITIPYFVPDEPLLAALTTATKRGVGVALILPAKVDSPLVRYASRVYYPLLPSAGVKPTMFEGELLYVKTMIIDEDYALFGMANMDMRDFFLDSKISLAIYDKHMTDRIYDPQCGYLADSRYISVRTWQQRAKWWGLVENTVRLMDPLL